MKLRNTLKPELPAPTLIIILLGLTTLIFFLTTLGLASNNPVARAAPAPARTVTVTQTREIPTGVSQSDFDACKGAYRDVVALLGEQTQILSSFAFTSSDAMNAVTDGDYAGVDAATTKINMLNAQEQGLQPKIQAVDSSACQ